MHIGPGPPLATLGQGSPEMHTGPGPSLAATEHGKPGQHTGPGPPFAATALLPSNVAVLARNISTTAIFLSLISLSPFKSVLLSLDTWILRKYSCVQVMRGWVSPLGWAIPALLLLNKTRQA